MPNYYLNYSPLFGLTVNTFRNNGVWCEDVGELVEEMLTENLSYCPLDGAKDALEDGEYWQGSGATQEILEEIHHVICEWEKAQEEDV